MHLFWDIFGFIASFFTGAFIGNFYHLVLFREAGGGYKLMLPPSCPRCGRPERRIWMLPIFWYLLVRGRCARCGQPFNKKYVIFEALVGLVFALVYFNYGPSLLLLHIALFFVFFFLNYFVHFRYGVILARLYVPALAIGFGLSFLPGGISPVDALLGMLLAGGFFFIPVPFGYDPLKKHPDYKQQTLLLLLIGVFLGWQSVFIVLALAAFAAVAIPRVFPREFGHDSGGVFAGSVFAGAILVAFYHRDLALLYLRLR
jgi:leader peptidase (prepilin peptidase)/N-methyltransferase